MKKISTLLLLLPAYAAMAQMDMGKHSCMMMHHDSTFSISTYRNIGVSFQQFDGLNDRIKQYPQYRELPDAMAVISLGTITRIKRFITVNTFNLGYGMRGKSSEKSSSLGFIGISGDLGYNILKPAGRVELFPTAGLGLEGYRARFNKDISDESFDNVLGSNTAQSNAKPLILTNGYFTYRVGLNVSAKSKDQNATIGLQAGYTGGFSKNSWKINEYQSLASAPEDNLSRLFFTLYVTKKLNWGNKRS